MRHSRGGRRRAARLAAMARALARAVVYHCTYKTTPSGELQPIVATKWIDGAWRMFTPADNLTGAFATAATWGTVWDTTNTQARRRTAAAQADIARRRGGAAAQWSLVGALSLDGGVGV